MAVMLRSRHSTIHTTKHMKYFAIFILFILIQELTCFGYSIRSSTVRNRSPSVSKNHWKRRTSVSNLFDNVLYDANDIPTTIRPAKFNGRGCVLLAQPNEFDHFLHKSVILIYNHSPQHGSVGVILDRPSPFTVDGAIPGFPEFRSNRLFLGGNDGSDTATIVHIHDLDMSKSIGFGLFIGGLKHAADLVGSNQLPASDFKFIFNNIEWGPDVLEKEIADKRWDVCQLPLDWVIDQSTGENLWEKCREELKKTNSLNLL